MNSGKNNRILLAPLDWGLGHAVRCIPIIRELHLKGCEVVLAADGSIATLLEDEFPGIKIIQLKGYNIKYSSRTSLFKSMLYQLPGILRTIQKEHRWLKKLLKSEHFDCIISDNRPGFWNKKVKCIYITHQLLIHSGKGKWMNRLLQKIHSSYIKRFDSVWVPDLEGPKNLAGELSHPITTNLHPKYIGFLSRLESEEPVSTEIDLLILLSGPEPQRTILEKKIVVQLKEYKCSVYFVRGLPNFHTSQITIPSNVKLFNYMPASTLQKVIAASKFIICRSGYTSLMDLINLNKKAILIPTPGQPEQEYLATYMQEQSYFPYVKQKEFDLRNSLKQAEQFTYQNPFHKKDFELFKNIIDKTINS
jgi:predicted glycosyltransferase